MNEQIIDLDAIQEPWKKDILMVAVFNALITIGEPRPASLDNIIDSRAHEILTALKKSVKKAFRKVPKEILESNDPYEAQNYLDPLISHSFRKLNDMEREILFCSNELHDFKDSWAWYEWDIVSELLPKKNNIVT